MSKMRCVPCKRQKKVIACDLPGVWEMDVDDCVGQTFQRETLNPPLF
jgi:hypothetical protein